MSDLPTPSVAANLDQALAEAAFARYCALVIEVSAKAINQVHDLSLPRLTKADVTHYTDTVRMFLKTIDDAAAEDEPI